MQAGKLRHEVTIRSRSGDIQAASGAVTPVRPVLATVWADVDELSGLELIRAQKRHAEATYRVVIRQLDGVDTASTIDHGSLRLDVVHVGTLDGRGRMLELLCKAVKS